MVNLVIGFVVGIVLCVVVAAVLGHTDADDYQDWEGEE